jgi:hypothetical protein
VTTSDYLDQDSQVLAHEPTISVENDDEVLEHRRKNSGVLASKNSLRQSKVSLNKKKRSTMAQEPTFPQVEGGRDFDEEVEDRIRLTRAYNEQVLAAVNASTTSLSQTRQSQILKGVDKNLDDKEEDRQQVFGTIFTTQKEISRNAIPRDAPDTKEVQQAKK